jgi:hypothetical protein
MPSCWSPTSAGCWLKAIELTPGIEQRALPLERAEQLIKAALWAFCTEEGSTASAYAYSAILEFALGLSDWTHRE